MNCSMAAVAAEAFSRWIWTSDASLSRNAKYASTAPLETTAPVTRPTTITTYFLNSRRRLDRNATSSVLSGYCAGSVTTGRRRRVETWSMTSSA